MGLRKREIIPLIKPKETKVMDEVTTQVTKEIVPYGRRLFSTDSMQGDRIDQSNEHIMYSNGEQVQESRWNNGSDSNNAIEVEAQSVAEILGFKKFEDSSYSNEYNNELYQGTYSQELPCNQIIESRIEEKYDEEETVIEIDKDLSYSKSKKQIEYKGGSAGALILGIPEKNIETNKVVLPIEFQYMNETIKVRLARDQALKRNGILDLSSKGADVDESNAGHHIRFLKYQERSKSEFHYSHTELGYGIYQDNEIFKLDEGINIESKYCGNEDISAKGELEDYLKFVKEYVSPNINMSIALLIGCTSALVSKLSKYNRIDLGNLLVHIAGDSSTGKSTATMLSVSVWSNPVLGKSKFYNSWNGTENSILTSLAGNHGVVQAFDEISACKVENMTNLVYNISAGKDKTRLTKEIEQRQAGTWNTTVISNGEVSMRSRCSGNTGIDIRLIEFQSVQWTVSASHSDQIKSFIKNNYGSIGRDFARRLVKCNIEGLDKVFKLEKKWFIENLVNRGLDDSKIQRTSEKYALISLAGILINSAYKDQKIVINLNEIREALIDVEKQSIQIRGVDKSAEEWILQMVESNSSKFKQDKEDKDNIDYWGSINKLQNGKTEISILKNKFEYIIEQGGFQDSQVILKQFKEKGKLDCEKDRLYRKRKINKVTTKVVVLLLEI